MLRLNKILSNYRRIMLQKQQQKSYDVQFYNCWEQANEEMYWNQFIQAKHLLDGSGKKVAVFSVFGPKRAVRWVNADVKIFFSAECLDRFPAYLGYCLEEKDIDLAMGFDFLENSRYIRFPLWMDYMFPANSSEKEIRRICEEIRYPKVGKRNKFCCMVASNSADGLRGEMFDKISRIAHVDSAGHYLHNDDSLLNNYDNNKNEYIRNYQFNICPENTSSYGYVSEKIFEAFKQGCIPIYWGSNGQVESEVVNRDALIYWDRDQGGKNALNQISELKDNPKLLSLFLSQPRLLPTAEEFVLDTYSQIYNKLLEIIKHK